MIQIDSSGVVDFSSQVVLENNFSSFFYYYYHAILHRQYSNNSENDSECFTSDTSLVNYLLTCRPADLNTSTFLLKPVAFNTHPISIFFMISTSIRNKFAGNKCQDASFYYTKIKGLLVCCPRIEAKVFSKSQSVRKNLITFFMILSSIYKI